MLHSRQFLCFKMIGARNLNTEAIGLLNCRRRWIPLSQINIMARGSQLRQGASQVLKFLTLSTTFL